MMRVTEAVAVDITRNTGKETTVMTVVTMAATIVKIAGPEG